MIMTRWQAKPRSILLLFRGEKKYNFQNFMVMVCCGGMKIITSFELSLTHYPNEDFTFLAPEQCVE